MQSVFKDICNEFGFLCVYIGSLYTKSLQSVAFAMLAGFRMKQHLCKTLYLERRMAQIHINPYTDI